jgi:hypothetical protein
LTTGDAVGGATVEVGTLATDEGFEAAVGGAVGAWVGMVIEGVLLHAASRMESRSARVVSARRGRPRRRAAARPDGPAAQSIDGSSRAQGSSAQTVYVQRAG